MATATKTTTPRRSRATAAKSTTPAAPPAVEPEESAEESYVFECVQLDDTKSYAVFAPPKDSGCVGKIYVPKGTARVRVRITGGADE